MREVRLGPGQYLLKETFEKQSKFYIIASGSVRLESMCNPFRKREDTKDSILKDISSH